MSIERMASDQSITTLLIEELNDTKVKIDELKKHKELKLKEKNTLRPLHLEEIKKFQRQNKQLRKLGSNIEEKSMVINHVVDTITVTNEKIIIYTNLKQFSKDYQQITIELASIRREELKMN